MNETDCYGQALMEARAEAVRLKRERDEIDKRLARVESGIQALTVLLNQTADADLGMTARIRVILRAATEPMTLAAIRVALEACGVDMSAYAQPTATLATALRRLVDRGEATPNSSPKGTIYTWKSDTSDPTEMPVLVGVHEEKAAETVAVRR